MPLTKIQSLGITDGTIVNADINASAAIVSTKLSGVQGKFESALLHVRDEKSAGTAGGDANNGSFQTRTLNTVMTNEISGASLASNQITLPTGTYYIYASGSAFQVQAHKMKLRNVTDSSDTLLGTSVFSTAAYEGKMQSMVIGRFTIASQKVFELQHRVADTKTTNGFGIASNFSVTEVYADVQIWKIA